MDKVTALLAVKANTRLVLDTELVARNAEVEELRALFSELRAESEALIAQNFALKRQITIPDPAIKTIAPRKSVPAHFAAAREAAMRTGKCIRVEV